VPSGAAGAAASASRGCSEDIDGRRLLVTYYVI